MSNDFSTVTELAGDDVTREQVERTCHRYYWALTYCEDKDVLEVACGNGIGLGYLAQKARSVQAGDIDPNLVERARKINDKSISIEVMDAQDLPFDNNSLDVVILFEALYYLPGPAKFVKECKRVLRKGGQLLIVTANKDLSDFNPSPFTHSYFGAIELPRLVGEHGFEAKVFGYWPLAQSSALHSVLRPVKKMLVASGLMPKSMAGKKILKRLVFGKLTPMPGKLEEGMIDFVFPLEISSDIADTSHKVIYCAAIKPDQQ